MVGEDSNMRAGFVVFAAVEAMIFWIMLQGLMCFECKIQDEEHSWGWWSDKRVERLCDAGGNWEDSEEIRRHVRWRMRCVPKL